MEYGFQKRLGIYTASKQIRTTMGDVGDFQNRNNNAVIRFLGYDSIIQPTLFLKLVVFMVVFGMNAPGKL